MKSFKQYLKENMNHGKDHEAVEELKSALLAKKEEIQSVKDDSDKVYNIIDKLMTAVAKSHGLSGQQMHDLWVDCYKEVPDTWIMHDRDGNSEYDSDAGKKQYTGKPVTATKAKKDVFKLLNKNFNKEEVEELFDIIEEMVEAAATEYNIDSELLWERLESVSDEELIEESAAWQRKAGKDPKGGLNRKGIASYRAQHPGSKLSMAVTTKPSKLKPGSKAANRRKSFCARMGGMQGAMKKPNGEPTRKALALRKWNC